MADLVWDCDCPGAGCSNSDHYDFWMPENWPYDRAPVRWTYTDRSERRAELRAAGDAFGARHTSDSIGVELWVPDICVPDAEDYPLASNLWWASCSAGDASWNVREWKRMEASLLAERDPILDRRESQDEAQWLAGALPG